MSAALRRRAGLTAALTGAAVLLLPGAAAAYCQTTTCDPSVTCEDEPQYCCDYDASGCDTNGIVLTWPSLCVSYSLNVDASPARSIDYTTFEAVLARSMEHWTALDCEGSAPSIKVENFGPVDCATPDYDSSEGKNSNVWMFRDDGWPYGASFSPADEVDASALALTTISFNFRTGELYDADVELNSAEVPFTASDENVGIDLESIITHEAGHFFGLDHSSEPLATMAAGYLAGTTEGRSLSADDRAGLCASYPASRSAPSASCEPRGDHDTCSGGCALAPLGGGSSGKGAALLGLAAALGLLARRRRLAQ